MKIIPGKLIATEDFKSSSSDKVYITTLYDNCMSCTCPAGGKKTLCKHIIAMAHKYNKTIESENLNFFKDLMAAIEAKNQKLPQQEQKVLAEKILYLNKEISEKAHTNTESRYDYKQKEFESLIDLIETNLNNKQKEIMLRALCAHKECIFKTKMYLLRRLEIKKELLYWDFVKDEYYSEEFNYSAGGKLVDKMLEKYTV